MFLPFLHLLREQDVPVGLTEWIAFLRGLTLGLATDVDGLYQYGRAVLCRTEADYDGYDTAFATMFRDAVLPEQMREELLEWLAEAANREQGDLVEPQWQNEELVREFLRRLAEQTEAHHGGNYWVGTGGTSPFGHSGRAKQGIRAGGTGGGRSAIRVASERRWANYRQDRAVDIRDLQVVLRALRSLSREGRMELDIDETIDQTARNGGDIDIVERRTRKNQLKVVLLLDAGGSMMPHAERVDRLFTAASSVKTFKSLDTWYFHNCVYGNLYRDMEELDRVPTTEVLAQLTPKHRLIFVGDASMAPYELSSSWGWTESDAPSGLDWLKRFKARCPAAVWLNPDPRKWWNHPTVAQIGRVFPMHELTVQGVGDAVRELRGGFLG
jgi:hypothetical protein